MSETLYSVIRMPLPHMVNSNLGSRNIIGKQSECHEVTRKEAKENDKHAVGVFKTSKQ